MSELEYGLPAYLEPVIGFRSRKAAQLCALFATSSRGCIEKLKLIKLVYLTERRHLATYEDTMLMDELFSLRNGPICSGTLNGINGEIHQEIWDDYLARNGNLIVALKSFSRDDLDELSNDEVDIANQIWEEFKGMTASQIRNFTHQNCPEYTEVDSGRLPIRYQDVLSAVGSSDANAIDADIMSLRRAEQVLTHAGRQRD